MKSTEEEIKDKASRKTAQEYEEIIKNQEENILNLRRQIALVVSGYIGAEDLASRAINEVKDALKKGLSHARSKLELSVTRFSKELKELTLCPDVPSIKTDVRLFDLVRYMRAELHQQGLISDKEYEWLLTENPGEPSSDGSPSRQRLETYDEMRAKLDKYKKN